MVRYPSLSLCHRGIMAVEEIEVVMSETQGVSGGGSKVATATCLFRLGPFRLSSFPQNITIFQEM